jgi:AraC-like DNA-binding protein
MDSSPKRGATGATVKVRNIGAIPMVLRELGVSPDIILKAAGITPELFANPENTLPYAEASRLVARCSAATECDDFGLRLGIQSGPPTIGLTGLVSVSCPTVREGLQVIVSTLQTSDTGGRAFLSVHDRSASLGYAITTSDVEAVDHIEDLAMAIGAKIMRQLCGPRWHPRRVELARKRPRDPALFVRFFGAPVHFECARPCLVFNAELLDRSVAGYDPIVAGVLTPLLDRAVADSRPDFLNTVKLIVRAQITSGTLSRDRVSQALGIHPRTLAYRLESHGLTYSGLADEARYDIACGLLLKDKPIAVVADMLGFAEQSGFTRAFKAWTGTTPARWRAERRGLCGV